mmetsp:Transcript_7693/g.32420  ORF Transcript_7693/g.32420 Transcript_7693/m.32420 type:complete len:336 (-) Transcript_7693:218-1225(-)
MEVELRQRDAVVRQRCEHEVVHVGRRLEVQVVVVVPLARRLVGAELLEVRLKEGADVGAELGEAGHDGELLAGAVLDDLLEEGVLLLELDGLLGRDSQVVRDEELVATVVVVLVAVVVVVGDLRLCVKVVLVVAPEANVLEHCVVLVPLVDAHREEAPVDRLRQLDRPQRLRLLPRDLHAQHLHLHVLAWPHHPHAVLDALLEVGPVPAAEDLNAAGRLVVEAGDLVVREDLDDDLGEHELVLDILEDDGGVLTDDLAPAAVGDEHAGHLHLLVPAGHVAGPTLLCLTEPKGRRLRDVGGLQHRAVLGAAVTVVRLDSGRCPALLLLLLHLLLDH